MKRIQKIVLAVLLLLSLALPVGAFEQPDMKAQSAGSGEILCYAFEQPDIKVEIKGQPVLFDTKPVMSNDRVLIPIRGAFEQMGGVVSWDGDTGKITIEKDTMTIELTIGQDIALIHRKYDFTGIPQEVQLDEAPRIIGDRAYVPVRFVAETLGMEVSWDNDTQTVKIDSSNVEVGPVEAPVAYEKISAEDIKGQAKVSEWYNSNYKTKGIYFMADSGDTYILVSGGEKPTGGYGIEIKSATMVAAGSVYLTAQVTKPTPDMMVTQVITYPNALLKVKGADITIVDGEVMDEENAGAGRSKGPLNTQGKGIATADIQSIELFDITGNKVKTFEEKDFEKIAAAYSEGIPTDDPYIMMITGNAMKITLKDETQINITSYGSDTFVVANVTGKDGSESYHLICPDIAKILLTDPAKL